MSAMMPTTHPLMDELLKKLLARGVQLDPKAQDAIEVEFGARHKRTNYSEEVIEVWQENLYRYVDLLDRTADELRKQRGLPPGAPVVLDEPSVRKTFATCSKLCPGPS